MTGFTDTFVMATVVVTVCALAGLLIPGRQAAVAARAVEAQLLASPEP